jgi:glutamate racemase
VQLVDSGEPVARQARRLLQAQAALSDRPSPNVLWIATDHPDRLETACRDWLQLAVKVSPVSI